MNKHAQLTSPEHREQKLTYAHKNLRRFLAYSVAILLVMALVYGWQHGRVTTLQHQNKDLQAQLALSEQRITKVSSLNDNQVDAIQQATDQSSSNNTDTQLITGQIDFNRDGKRGNAATMYFDCLVKPSASLKEVWIEYGNAPDTLKSQTKHLSSGLGEGSPDTYAATSFPIQKSSLKPGAYYYRVAASTTDGKILRSGIASFAMPK